jgi:hypothetical protein
MLQIGCDHGLSRSVLRSKRHSDRCRSDIVSADPHGAIGIEHSSIQLGFPCCVRFPCVHAAATTPVQRLGVPLAHLTQPYQPSPIPLSGRPAHRPFRGLLGVHSRCGLHTRAVTYRGRYPGASDISSPPCLPRLLPAGAVAGWALHPLESAALSRRTWKPVIASEERTGREAP